METQIIHKLTNFFSKFTPSSFKRGDVLIPGNTPTGVFFLRTGFVKQYAATANGDHILLNIYKPYTFFPMMWVLSDLPNRYFFEALNSIEVYRAPKDQVYQFITSEPDVLVDLTRRVYIGMEDIICRFEQSIQGNAYNKIICSLLILANHFSDPSFSDKVTIKLPLNQDMLASIAGTTKETYSRTLSRLRQKNLVISQKQTLILPDLSALRNELAV